MRRRLSRRLTVGLCSLVFLLAQGCGQDLQKENESLKAEINTVRGENASLNEKLEMLQAEKTTLTTQIETLEKQIADLEQAVEAAKKAAAPKRKGG